MRKLLIVCLLSSIGFFGILGNAYAEVHQWRASWYGPGLQGNLMANGERFDMNDPTVVAHKTLPFGTRLRVTNPTNGRSLTVTVQDRGPYAHGRHLDLSRAAAERLGYINSGVITLRVEIL